MRASVFIATGLDGLIAREDGGKTVQGFLAEGLIQRLITTRIPILIGRGIPLFGPIPADIRLRHVGTRAHASGLVQSEYQVVPPTPS